MTKARKYAAVIEVGAAIGSSLKTSIKTVRGGLAGVGDSIRSIKTQQDKLEKFDPSSVRKAGREYRELKRDAARLRTEYDKAKKPTAAMRREMERAQKVADKAGKSYRTQREKLNGLEKELKQAGVNTKSYRLEQKRLAAEMKKVQRRHDAMRKALDAGVGEKFTNMVGSAARSATVLATAVGGVGAAITMTNQMTARQEALAKSLNVSSDELQAWGGLAKEAGFEIDNVGDLIEEMTNKLGESKGLEQITPVTEALEILGLQFEDLASMAPEDQFRAIAKAAKELEDQQAAVSAADILMGGEANKFIGYLRSRKEGVDELLDQQKQLNVLTDEGREGAFKYNVAMTKFMTVVSSTWQEVAGVVGGALSPLVDDLGPKLAGWVRENKDSIRGVGTAISENLPKFIELGKGVVGALAAVGSAILWVSDVLGPFGTKTVIIGAVVGKLAWSVGTFGASLWKAGAALAPLVSTALPGLVVGIKAVGVAMMANPIGLIVGAIALAAAGVYRLITAWDELKKAFSVGGAWGAVKTFFGFGGEDTLEVGSAARAPANNAAMATGGSGSIPSLPPVQRGGSTTVSQQVGDIHIQAAPGQDPEEIAEATLRRIKEKQDEDAAGAMYDDSDLAWSS